MKFAVDAVLFDLDGTLLDTLPDLLTAANRMLAELGQASRTYAEVRRFVGKGIPNLVQRCLSDDRSVDPALVEAGLPVYRRHYAVVNGDATRIYDGVEPTLKQLKAQGIRLGLVTNKAQAFTLPLLEHVGLARYFDAVVSGDVLPQKKPDPAPLLHACAQIGVSPARAIMIGDSANDAEAAQAAGMPVLLANYGYSEGRPVDTIKCDGVISALPELLRYIERRSGDT
ncbi:MAG: phosphoglycolate phosphatase [Betaproteobacteria bacterium]|nr:phosphoglycolate phosphatase [Betaproteobacteria bacterium]